MDMLLFCSECHRYIGESDSCSFCGWVRPPAERLAKPGEPLWRSPAPDAPRGSVCLAGDSALLSSPHSGLMSARLTDGSLQWRYPTATHLRGVLSASSGRVYACDRQLGLLVLHPDPSAEDGVRLAWKYPLAGGSGRPALDGKTLWVSNSEGRLYHIRDAGDQPDVLNEIVTGQPVHAAPFRRGSMLMALTFHPRGRLLCLDPERGGEIWQREINARGQWLLPLADSLTGQPQAALVVTDQGMLMAYSLPDGDPLGWRFLAAGGLTVQPVTHGRVLYLAGGDGILQRLDWRSGAAVPLVQLDSPASGLAWWRGLLYAVTTGGRLVVLDAESGVMYQQQHLPGEAAGGLALRADGLLVLGSGEGWAAYPWHLGDYAWAASRCNAWNDPEQAAGFLALGGDKAGAAQAWIDARKPEQAARFWSSLGYVEQAALAYQKAAELRETHVPAQAAAHLNQAADHFELAGQQAQAADCRKRAARMGKYPYLRLDAFTELAGEAGQPTCFTLRVRNQGNAAAQEVFFSLGGPLARLVTFRLDQPLPAGAEAVLELDQLIPTRIGPGSLLVALTYKDSFGSLNNMDAHFDIHISAPPPGALTFTDDVGLVHVSVPEGVPLPVIRSRPGTRFGAVWVEVIERKQA